MTSKSTPILLVTVLLAACSTASLPEDGGQATGESMTAATDSNPLLADWDTPFGAPPLDAIEEAHFLPAYDVALASHTAEIEAIASNPEAPTFDNTMLAMQQAGRELGRISRVFFNLTSSASNDGIRAIQREMSPRLAAHSASITLNPDLFARIDALYQQRETLGMEPQQARLLETTREDFIRAGAQLEGADRERFAETRSSLAGLYTRFAQNEQADREAWTLELSPEDVALLPDFIVSAAAGAAADRGMDGHVITLARSSVEPFLQASPNREQREIAWRAWTQRGSNANAND
ncbi:MAG: peptidase M3, partial [Bacteroidota bacterium]